MERALQDTQSTLRMMVCPGNTLSISGADRTRSVGWQLLTRTYFMYWLAGFEQLPQQVDKARSLGCVAVSEGNHLPVGSNPVLTKINSFALIPEEF
jgi:hypothetical protein